MGETTAANGNGKKILNGASLVPLGVVVAVILGVATLAMSLGDWRERDATRKAEVKAELISLREDLDRLEEDIRKIRDVELELVDSRQRKIEISLKSQGIME